MPRKPAASLSVSQLEGEKKGSQRAETAKLWNTRGSKDHDGTPQWERHATHARLACKVAGKIGRKCRDCELFSGWLSGGLHTLRLSLGTLGAITELGLAADGRGSPAAFKQHIRIGTQPLSDQRVNSVEKQPRGSSNK